MQGSCQIELIQAVCRRFYPFVVVDGDFFPIQTFFLKIHKLPGDCRVIETYASFFIINGNRLKFGRDISPNGCFAVAQLSCLSNDLGDHLVNGLLLCFHKHSLLDIVR